MTTATGSKAERGRGMALLSFWLALAFIAFRSALPAPDAATAPVLASHAAATSPFLSDEVPDWTGGQQLVVVEAVDSRADTRAGHEGGLDLAAPSRPFAASPSGRLPRTRSAASLQPERHRALGFDARAPPSVV